MKRKGSKYYWEGWDSASNKEKKKNPYPKIKGEAHKLEKNNEPHFMWSFGYDTYVATAKTFGKLL